MGIIPFVLPRAEINPIEGLKATFDVLVEKYRIKDPTISLIQDIICDFEVDRISKTDDEILYKSFIVFDSLYSQLSIEVKEKGW